MLRRIDAALQLLSPQGMPNELAFNHGVQPVVNLLDSQSVRTAAWCNGQSPDIGGGANFDWRMISRDTSLFPTLGIVNTDLDSRILALSIILGFNAAGALAFNGKTVSVKLFLNDLLGSGAVVRLAIIRPAWVIATTQLEYNFQIWGYREALLAANQFGLTGFPALILDGTELEAQVVSDDGTVFPATTTVTSQLHLVQVPAGFTPPY